jgi:transcriptional regulator with XRE-family HTH domain
VTAADVREGRKAKGWTQTDLARKLGVSQGYVSLLESKLRSVPRRLAPLLVSALGVSPTRLPMTNSTPLSPDRVAAALGTLGYPGFAHLRSRHKLNPAEVVVRALRANSVEARVVEALPWVLVQYPELDWHWLLREAKQNDLQNRLGFVVTVAVTLAERQNNVTAATTLRTWAHRLENSRLAKEDAFAGDALTEAERRWLDAHRSAEGAHWNLLTSVSADTLNREF